MSEKDGRKRKRGRERNEKREMCVSVEEIQKREKEVDRE